jgi:outer membrane lipoprotein SlyB
MSGKSRLFAVSCALGFVTGCAPALSPNVYSAGDPMQAWKVAAGEVVEVRNVLRRHARADGHRGWWYIGYEVGRSIGDGSGRDIAGAVGTVAGAAAGRAVETAATRQQGIEITVRLDDGDTVAIVQSASVGFSSGERVNVLRRGNGQARVTKT